MKISYLSAVCVLFVGACSSWAEDRYLPFDNDIDLPVISIEAGRKLCVQPDISGSLEDGWRYFPAFETPPATPEQSSILLTDEDSLVISVPMFAYRPMLGCFDTEFKQEGNQLYLDGYTLLSGGVTATIYGPTEFLKRIGSLAPGDYTLNVRKFHGFDPMLRDFDAFKADPESYTASLEGASFSIAQETLHFTVVPEPNAGMLFAMAAGSMSLVSFIKRRRSR